MKTTEDNISPAPTAPKTTLDLYRSADSFTRAYVQTALWSSTGHKCGACPCCGRVAVLDRYPEPEFNQEPMCSAPGCGVREVEPEPLDRHYSVGDIAPETMAKMMADCAKFQADNMDTLTAAIATGEVKCGPDFDAWEHAGHDFWLTRCNHGSGYWDGDWPEPFGDKLTKSAHAFGNIDLYVGDDGRLHA